MTQKNKTNYVLGVVLAAAIFNAMPGFAETSASDARAVRFRENVGRILNQACLKNNNYGVKIYSLDRKDILYQINADRPLTPASNMKLITTAAALKELGPDYRFNTHLYTNGVIEGDVLKGDLYIKGFGDPKLVSEQLWLMVNEFRNLPIRKVTGDIIADDSYFDGELRNKTWRKQRSAAAPYYAPMGALSFNFNTVTVYAKPGHTPGAKPLVVIDPGSDYIHVSNGGTTLSGRRGGGLFVNRYDKDNYDEIRISGGIPINETRARYFLNITNPTIYTVNVFKEFLSGAGVEVGGKVRTGVVPGNSHLLLTHESEALSEIIKGLNKFSNNFTAEQILKAVGAEKFGAPGTTENGVKALTQYMQSLGFAADQFQIFDGSGLSPFNKVSPNQFVRILETVHNDWSIYPEFFSSLGIMGVDGSVRKRLKNLDESQRARAKTGTLNFTSAISGYFQSKEGERFAFSIIMNDLRCSPHAATKIQDKIIHEGLDFQRGN